MVGFNSVKNNQTTTTRAFLTLFNFPPSDQTPLDRTYLHSLPSRNGQWVDASVILRLELLLQRVLAGPEYEDRVACVLGRKTGIILQSEILFLGSLNITIVFKPNIIQFTGIEDIVRIETVLTANKTYYWLVITLPNNWTRLRNKLRRTH